MIISNFYLHITQLRPARAGLAHFEIEPDRAFRIKTNGPQKALIKFCKFFGDRYRFYHFSNPTLFQNLNFWWSISELFFIKYFSVDLSKKIIKTHQTKQYQILSTYIV